MAVRKHKICIGYEDAPRPVAQAETPALRGQGETASGVTVAPFREVAVLPNEQDNCAIAVRTLARGLRVSMPDGASLTLQHMVLEGHRFVVRPIQAGARLTSWALGFGTATRDLQPGEYCCNDSILVALRERGITADLPDAGCFENFADPLPDPNRERNHESGILPLETAADGTALGFQGFSRSDGRGVGTRNYVTILGTSGRVAAVARRIERRFRGAAGGSLDGVVAVAHTEGNDSDGALNRDKVMLCLAGWLAHPNVGACLVVEHPQSQYRRALETLMSENPQLYPRIEDLSLRWLTVGEDTDEDLMRAAKLVEELLPLARSSERSWQPANALVVAQQCGGSDAFSGVAGNPASGVAVRKLIAAGGKSVLAETDELIGAEAYVLSRIKSRAVEDKFLEFNARYRDYANRHGHSPEGNPSGGNKFRGLYNIALKSVGAAMKKPREARLDGCVEYGERITEEGGGYYFMDSPGNDPESIAGQVACGCNVVHFITGNGSITNFPFVPTIKIITTTARWNLLSADMDFNAGRLQEGESLESLGEELFQETLKVGGGKRTVGEKAGHWQVCIWRDWLLGEGARQEEIARAQAEEELAVAPLAARAGAVSTGRRSWDAVESSSPGLRSARSVALLLPTSLCSGQVALKIAEELRPQARDNGFEDVVALPHTEGCGTSSSPKQDSIFRNVMVGHLLHPSVRRAVLLEHGCEKTHNDWFSARLAELGKDPGSFGWASIQLDGGIENVTAKIRELLLNQQRPCATVARVTAGLSELRLGIVSDHRLAKCPGLVVAALAAEALRAGGTVVLPQGNELLGTAEFLDELLEGGSGALRPTIAFAAPVTTAPGLHVMACPPKLSLTEQITGLAASGVDCIVALVRAPAVGSPLVPVVQVRSVDGPPRHDESNQGSALNYDVSLFSGESTTEGAERLWGALLDIVGGRSRPKLLGAIGEANVDFIVPRGPTGVSL